MPIENPGLALENISMMVGKSVLESDPAIAEKTVAIPQSRNIAIYKKGMKRNSHDMNTLNPAKRRKAVNLEENRRVTRSMTKAWSE